MPVDRNIESVDKSSSEASSPEAPAFVTSELNNELGGGVSPEAAPEYQASEADVTSTSNQWSVDQPTLSENSEDEFSVPRLRARKQVLIRRPDADGQIATRKEWVPLRQRCKNTCVSSGSDTDEQDSIHLADSEFMFEENTRCGARRYGLRRQAKPRERYSP